MYVHVLVYLFYLLYLRLMINSFIQALSSISFQGKTFVDLGAIQRLSISVAILSILQSRPGIKVPTNAGLQTRTFILYTNTYKDNYYSCMHSCMHPKISQKIYNIQLTNTNFVFQCS